jgi:hypothetical protein
MTKYEAGDEILYADIEKGDRIRRTEKYSDGGVAIYEGFAATKGSFYWDTSEALTLAFDDDDDDDTILLELVERPKDPLPEATGSIIKARKVRGTVGEFILTRDATGTWRSIELIEDTYYCGDYYWHSEENIEDWTEMELVEKK